MDGGDRDQLGDPDGVPVAHDRAAVALLALERAGLESLPGPMAAWWLQRPLWLVVPGIVLAVLVAVFARFELPRRRTHPAGSR